MEKMKSFSYSSSVRVLLTSTKGIKKPVIILQNYVTLITSEILKGAALTAFLIDVMISALMNHLFI
jgi:hypothetical protein